MNKPINLYNFIKEETGLRLSPRLNGCLDIVRAFALSPYFGRAELLRPENGLSLIYDERCLERSLKSLISSELLIELKVRRPEVGGGRLFTASEKLKNF